MNIATIGVEDWLNVHEKSATVDIAQSTIASLTMDEILKLDGTDGQGFYEQLGREKMNYGWIEGSPEFKQEVAALYQNVDPENILQTNGATGANLLALMTLVEPGDHVIAEYPTYQPLYEIPRTLGAEVEYWHIQEELGWQPDIAELERLVRPNTKLICINNASNPLGTVLPRETLEQIVEIARSVGAYVLSDEVYLPLEDTDRFVSMADLYDRAVVTNSISKTYSVPAARIGWTVSNAEVADRNPHVPRLHAHLRRHLQRRARRARAGKTASASWSATAPSCSGTAPSPRRGSTPSRACAGCRRRVSRPRTSSSTSPWMTRSSA